MARQLTTGAASLASAVTSCLTHPLSVVALCPTHSLSVVPLCLTLCAATSSQ